MIVCALKLTHDGGVALVDGERLVGSVEMEKLQNRPRHSGIEDLSVVPEVLSELGAEVGDIDEFVVDGWVDGIPLHVRDRERAVDLSVARYQEQHAGDDLFAAIRGSGLVLGGLELDFTSVPHVAGHVASAWASSPFAERGEGAYVLVWDGGMLPRLYVLDASSRTARNLGPIFQLLGNVYPYFTRTFGPFQGIWKSGLPEPEITIAGKLMAYVAFGTVQESLLAALGEIYAEQFGGPQPHLAPRLFPRENDGSGQSERVPRFIADVQRRSRELGSSDEDVLASLHFFLEELLVNGLRQRISSEPAGHRNLCLSGGCALNIKWNSAIRRSGIFEQVWVPPFPGDSGSAIGAACCRLLRQPAFRHLRWDVYAGPRLAPSAAEPAWSERECSIEALADLLHEGGAPVVFLDGRAELGPRALGHRSLLAPAIAPWMRDLLNRIKGRELFRPVAPICLEEHAPEIFDPGTRDPFMLFDHMVRPSWRSRVPAIVHHDGSARLQTVAATDKSPVALLLRAYHRRSGVPLLCNTSANFPGCGFFPDVASAMRWGRARYIWSDDRLFERE